MTGNRSSAARSSFLSGARLLLAFSALAVAGWLMYAVALVRSHQIGALELFPRDHPFTDFYLYKPTFDVFHTALFFQPNEGRSGFAYPPLVAPLYRFFYLQTHRFSWYLCFTIVLWGGLVAWVVASYRAAAHRGRFNPFLLTTALLCYPALFLLERGNLELFVWGAIAAGMYSFVRGHRNAAATLVGLATALKLYPILLLGLFLERRAWRSMLLGVATAVFATAAAIAYTGPSFALAANGFLHGVTGFQQHYGRTIRPAELRFDHSLFAIVKVMCLRWNRSPGAFAPWYYLSGALVISWLFFARVARRPWQNRLLFLTVAMLLLPPVSYEYTLVHLYVPLLLFMSLAARVRLRPVGLLLWGDLLLLLLPGDLFRFSNWFQAGQVQAVLLVIALILTTTTLQRSPSIAFASENSPAPAVLPVYGGDGTAHSGATLTAKI